MNLISNTLENLKPGVLLKTINALEYINNHYEYKFIIRTNLSSFFIFDRLYNYISVLDPKGIYEGVINRKKTGAYASGAGFILSPDLVVKLLTLKQEYDLFAINDNSDDKVIGAFFRTKNIKVRNSRHRFDLCVFPDLHLTDITYKKIDTAIDRIKKLPRFYHIRIKAFHDRLKTDSYAMNKALTTFYP